MNDADIAKQRRRLAEACVAGMGDADVAHLPTDSQELIHELRTYQIELKLQNEELRRTEIELTEAHDQLADLYDFAPVGYLTIGHNGLIKKANLTLADMLGVERRGLVNQPFSAFVARADQDAYYLLRQRVLDGSQSGSVELRLQPRHADQCWVHMEARAERNTGAEEAGLLVTLSDINARKQADADSIRLAQVVEQAGESVMITDRDGIITYVNPTFTRLTGFSFNEVIGHTPRLLNSGKQDAAFYTAMWNTITGGNIWHGKVIDRHKDGSLYPVMLTISPLYEEATDKLKYTGFVGIMADLSRVEDLQHQFQQGHGSIECDATLPVYQGVTEIIACVIA